LKGRSEWRDQVGRIRSAEPGEFRVHFHASSVGEFEQAKPIIEALRSEGRPYRITASFFSPSGFEQQGRYEGIDGACYIPHDRQGEMSEFMNRISPDLVIIIRYDLWLEFLRQARVRRIPVVLVCGVLRSASSRFSPIVRSFFEKLYRQLSLIHAVSEEDRQAFRRLAPNVPVEVSGDTRYDRVIARARAAARFEQFTPEMIAGRTVLVAGSTWPADEELLEVLRGREDLLLIVVPHEPSKEHVESILARFAGARTLSEIEREGTNTLPHTIVIDRTGILAALYRIGSIAYVGGGFGDGVHSVLEPASYGIPVLCGPRTGRSRDAEEMRRMERLQVVEREEQLLGAVESFLVDSELRARAGAAAREFVEGHAGATGRILASLETHGYLPVVTVGES
jgi:3-deoxy-D-manno-octulosonic-acid transferase